MMSELVALILFGVLAVVAAIHFFWAFGGVWPARDEASLAKTVVGVKDMRKMPGTGITVLVSCLIAVAAILPLVFAGLLPNPFPVLMPFIPQQGLATVILGGLALIFLGRGLLSYTAYFRKMEAEEPFVTLDRRYYAPLCLLLGGGFLLLFLGT